MRDGMYLSRRGSLGLLASLVVAARASAAPGTPQFGPATPFSFDRLVERAQALAARPYAPRPAARDVPHNFDAAGRIAYGAADRLAGLVRLLPATWLAPVPVGIHLVEHGMARPLLSTRGLFAGDATTPASGFRILEPDLKSDWLAFQGASYFRSSGSQDQYGLSMRGIAVDTGIAGQEEFPSFTDFWIEALGPKRYRIHALLDGPSLAGAYVFDCASGQDGVTQQVQASLFVRRDIARFGIAPATSMFWYGEGDRAHATDWRPEIHDSDGLALWTGAGERIWRPLSNPGAPRTSAFRADGIKGFGLLQRDRRFADYQDDGAFYERRPNLWVEPLGDWGKGAVMLYEIPTQGETDDNIVAFWVSDRAAKAGERRDLAYRLRWTSNDPSDTGAARVVDLWTGTAGRPGEPPTPGARKYMIDFEGPNLAGLDRDSGVEAVVNVAKPALLALSAYPVARQNARWRVMLDLRSAPANPKELRLFLRRGASALSETLIEALA